MRTINVPKRSVVIAGHKTSITVEEGFWDCLKEIAAIRGTTVAALVSQVDENRAQANRSSAIRLFVLDYVRANAAQVDSVIG